MRAWKTGMAAAAMIALPAVAGSQLQQSRSVSMLRGAQGWSPALFVCDGINRDRAYVMSAPDAQRRARLTSLTRPGLAAQSIPVVLGQGEAGMSQLRYPLADATGRTIGTIHTISPSVVEPGATTPTVTGVTIGRQRTDCRFAPQTRVLGISARRSIQVTATPRTGYRYRSYDHDAALPPIDQPWGGRDTRASLTLDNGRLVDRRGARRIYEFRNADHVYRVMVSVDPAQAGGGVQVIRAGRVIANEAFGAYTAALQP